jgi:hypothetical protein
VLYDSVINGTVVKTKKGGIKMNIFVLDRCPSKAAMKQCDKHVVKMCLETAQLLCTYFNKRGYEMPYRSTHVKHPCSLWLDENADHVSWLIAHFRALLDEYKHRYGKQHACEKIYNQLPFKSRVDPDTISFSVVTNNSIEDPVVSYQQYYKEKPIQMNWTNRPVPQFMKG